MYHFLSLIQGIAPFLPPIAGSSICRSSIKVHLAYLKPFDEGDYLAICDLAVFFGYSGPTNGLRISDTPIFTLWDPGVIQIS